ncbi:transposable element Tcb2 transposase [Trichonephila clavipes]|nr:transposable element Tcb2 transposase [Trichonephila clavipes]
MGKKYLLRIAIPGYRPSIENVELISSVQHNAFQDKNSRTTVMVSFLDVTGKKPCPDLSPNQNALKIASSTEPTLIRKEDTTPLTVVQFLCSLNHSKLRHLSPRYCRELLSNDTCCLPLASFRLQDDMSVIPCSCRPRAATTNLSNNCICGLERFPSARNYTFVDSELCSYTGDGTPLLQLSDHSSTHEVVQARRNRRQTAGEIARHTTQATGRPISRFTVARRLHGGGLFARRPVRCVPLTPAHRRRRYLWCREHRNWRDNEWGRVLFTNKSRFSLSSDSHRILIWRERGSRNYPSNIIERDRYGGRGVLVWGGIMLGSCTDLHIFDAGSVNGTRYCNEILLPYVRLFRSAMGLQFLFMDDNAPCHRTVAAEQLLESRRFAARTLSPVTIRELRLALQDEWAAMPQQLIDTLILSMARRCETCLASPNLEMESAISRQIPDGILKWKIVSSDDPDQDNGTKLSNYCTVIGSGQMSKISD